MSHTLSRTIILNYGQTESLPFEKKNNFQSNVNWIVLCIVAQPRCIQQKPFLLLKNCCLPTS